MYRLIQATQWIFCLVSLMLTSLFALLLSGMTDVLSQPDRGARVVFLAIVFVLVGICIDIGKYLFWAQRRLGRIYGAMGLVLMGFSWLASCAFLVSSEQSLLSSARLESTEYLALQQRITSLHRQIDHYEELLEKRVNSAYHSQWAEGQRNADHLAALRESLAQLMEASSSVGKSAAQDRVVTTRFFHDISQVLKVSTEITRAVGYGLLSLLLEISTLGMISLAQGFKESSATEGSDPVGVHSNDRKMWDEETRRSMARLSGDILDGAIPPVLRRIRAAHYGLDIDAIRYVLSGLLAAGVIEADKRNSYKLSEFLGGVQEQSVLPLKQG